MQENKINHNSIHEAMAAVLGEIQDPPLDSVNPHFKSKYSSLPAVLGSIRSLASKHGLAVIQITDDQKLITRVIHVSGGTIESSTTLPATTNMQALGSAITYARRHHLTAIFGICGNEDDDGDQSKAIAKPKSAKPQPTTATSPSTSLAQIKKILVELGINTQEGALEFLRDNLGVDISNFKLPEQKLKNILSKLLIYKNDKNRGPNQESI